MSPGPAVHHLRSTNVVAGGKCDPASHPPTTPQHLCQGQVILEKQGRDGRNETAWPGAKTCRSNTTRAQTQVNVSQESGQARVSVCWTPKAARGVVGGGNSRGFQKLKGHFSSERHLLSMTYWRHGGKHEGGRDPVSHSVSHRELKYWQKTWSNLVIPGNNTQLKNNMLCSEG